MAMMNFSGTQKTQSQTPNQNQYLQGNPATQNTANTNWMNPNSQPPSQPSNAAMQPQQSMQNANQGTALGQIQQGQASIFQGNRGIIGNDNPGFRPWSESGGNQIAAPNIRPGEMNPPPLRNGMGEDELNSYISNQYGQRGRTASEGDLKTWRDYYNSPQYASGQGSDFWGKQLGGLLDEYQQYGNHDRSAKQLAEYQGQNQGQGPGNMQQMQQFLPQLMQMFKGMNPNQNVMKPQQQVSQGNLFNAGQNQNQNNQMDISTFLQPNQANSQMFLGGGVVDPITGQRRNPGIGEPQ